MHLFRDFGFAEFFGYDRVRLYADYCLYGKVYVFIEVPRKVVRAELRAGNEPVFNEVFHPVGQEIEVVAGKFNVAARKQYSSLHNEHISALFYGHLIVCVVNVTARR